MKYFLLIIILLTSKFSFTQKIDTIQMTGLSATEIDSFTYSVINNYSNKIKGRDSNTIKFTFDTKAKITNYWNKKKHLLKVTQVYSYSDLTFVIIYKVKENRCYLLENSKDTIALNSSFKKNYGRIPNYYFLSDNSDTIPFIAFSYGASGEPSENIEHALNYYRNGDIEQLIEMLFSIDHGISTCGYLFLSQMDVPLDKGILKRMENISMYPIEVRYGCTYREYSDPNKLIENENFKLLFIM